MTFTTRRTSINSENDVIFALSKLRRDIVEIGFSEYDVTRVVTASSELLSNILKYAGKGEFRYSKLVDGGKLGVKIVASDKGKGIANVEQAMLDNFSSSGTLGLGLPGVKRMADDFEMNSEVGIGTTVAFTLWQA